MWIAFWTINEDSFWSSTDHNPGPVYVLLRITGVELLAVVSEVSVQ